MKSHPHSFHYHRQGMTLIELLVVISIIGVLAGLILPALSKAKQKGRETLARKDISDIKGAISVYQQDYNRLPTSSQPVPPDVTPSAGMLGTDFTYGTTGTGYGTNIYNNNNVAVAGNVYQNNNSELMVILNGGITNPVPPNPSYPIHSSVQNNQRNPRKTGYYNPKLSPNAGATAGPGMGTDGVMRDPWGNPYIIALDLNYDGWVSNSVYNALAMNSGTTTLVQQGAPGSSTYAVKDSVTIFSFGQDGFFDRTQPGDATPNRDNILSWK